MNKSQSTEIPLAIKLLHLCFGCSDFLTGTVLIAIPSQVFEIFKLEPLPSEPTYVSFIGVFVMLTGLYYSLPFVLGNVFQFIQIWIITALIRICVCLFVLYSVLKAELSLMWLSVSGTDIAIALMQIYFIKRLKNA